MSIAIRQPVKIHITWGMLKGKPRIRAALHAALVRALRTAVRQTITVMEEIVPESVFRDPPYPASYDSEQLLQTAIIVLRQSLKEMGAGGFKKRYFLRYGYPAEYAKYVNRMRNVRWSKEGSGAGFYGEGKKILIQAMRKALKYEIARQPELGIYLGVKKYG